MTALEDPGLFAPPARWRRPALWMAALSLSLLIGGLVFVALPGSMSGEVAWAFSVNHSLRQADLIGLALVTAGMGLTCVTGWIWQR